MVRNKQLIKLRVSEWRRAMKRRAVDYKGGKCSICGYSKSVAAMDFHHLDPSKKEFGISSEGITRGWNKVKTELEKCILACKNCHAEIHEVEDNKIAELNRIKAKDALENIRGLKIVTECSNCKCRLERSKRAIKDQIYIFCGTECSKKFFHEFNWPSDESLAQMITVMNTRDLSKKIGMSLSSTYDRIRNLKIARPELFVIIKPNKRKVIWATKEDLQILLWEKPTTHIAKEYGVSDKAVEKWAKKYNLAKPPRGYWQKLICPKSFKK